MCSARSPAAPQVTPRDYLETALQPLQGSGRAVDSKNQASAAGAACVAVLWGIFLWATALFVQHVAHVVPSLPSPCKACR